MKYQKLLVAVVIILAGGIYLVRDSLQSVPHLKRSEACISSQARYCIASDIVGKTFSSNISSDVTFSIVDDRDEIVHGFMITHTKPLHVIVVRKDLASFQHLHPEFDPSTGIFTLRDVTFSADGAYRIFADFATADGEVVTIFEDVVVGSSYTPDEIGNEEKAKVFDGISVSLATDPAPESGRDIVLTFDLARDGEPVTDLQEYLGALGHAVILREDTLDFIHAHPVEDMNRTQDGRVSFIVRFPEAGKYKVFTQFQREGKVITTDFVLSVAKGAQTVAPPVDHSMH